jgi:hypothetical protein
MNDASFVEAFELVSDDKLDSIRARADEVCDDQIDLTVHLTLCLVKACESVEVAELLVDYVKQRLRQEALMSRD